MTDQPYPANVRALHWASTKLGDPQCPQLKGFTWLTLSALACHADDDGVTYVSQRDLAERCSLARQSIMKYEAELVELGLISKSPRYEGGHRTTDKIQLELAQ